MEYKTIDQSVTFNASAHEIYEMLMDQQKHSEFTGAPAKISSEIGGEFSIMDGGLSGKTLDLIADKKIVQAWRAADWPEGHYSTAIFLMEESDGQTKLSFVQAGVPSDMFDSINDGWRTYYWEPIAKALEN
jgi:activator of HSP90 ATPase